MEDHLYQDLYGTWAKRLLNEDYDTWTKKDPEYQVYEEIEEIRYLWLLNVEVPTILRCRLIHFDTLKKVQNVPRYEKCRFHFS